MIVRQASRKKCVMAFSTAQTVYDSSRGEVGCQISWKRSSDRLLKSLFLVVFVLADVCRGKCHNWCSNNGRCTADNTCECIKGWTGADCSIAVCPFGKAWADTATSIDVAHRRAECSNRGVCSNGVCKCDPTVTGHSCQRLRCDCSEHGKCMTLGQLAEITPSARHKVTLETDRYDYVLPWDVDMIQGCVCDEGYTEPDCSFRACPDGDDPLTTGQKDEIQLLNCRASGGSLYLVFQGSTSVLIPFDASAATLETALQAMPGLSAVTVTYSQTSPTNTGLCTNAGTNVAIITFTGLWGKLPALEVIPNNLIQNYLGSQATVQVAVHGQVILSIASVTGEKEKDPCANRGFCDTRQGFCTCYAGFGTSLRGDCSVVLNNNQASCPGEISCSGHGICMTDGDAYRCACSDGWTSGDCSERTCLLGRTWFSYPTGPNNAHQKLVECSNRGHCDRTRGQCVCITGFAGSNCEIMDCPGVTITSTVPCNGRGQCLTVAQLADANTVNGDSSPQVYGSDPNNPLTWDADMVKGCLCDPGFSGYDCSERTCLRGDDPMTENQVDEVKLFRCIATGGSFTLTFRRGTTIPLFVTSTVQDVKTALEELPSTGQVNVEFIGPGSGVCDPDGFMTTKITFLTEHGDLPPLHVDSSNLDLHTTQVWGDGRVVTAEKGTSLDMMTSVTGTKENAECSNRGICNKRTGKCDCFPGYGPSDGIGGIGTLDNCGYHSTVQSRNIFP